MGSPGSGTDVLRPPQCKEVTTGHPISAFLQELHTASHDQGGSLYFSKDWAKSSATLSYHMMKGLPKQHSLLRKPSREMQSGLLFLTMGRAELEDHHISNKTRVSSMLSAHTFSIAWGSRRWTGSFNHSTAQSRACLSQLKNLIFGLPGSLACSVLEQHPSEVHAFPVSIW